MASRLTTRSLLMALSLGACLLLTLTARLDARPKYKRAFEVTYPDVVKKSGRDGKINCNVCHFGDDKKKRNHYAEALAKELKKPNVMDEKTIKEALKAIEDGKCRSGEWKERLDEGKFPCDCGSRDHDPSSYVAHQLAREHCESR